MISPHFCSVDSLIIIRPSSHTKGSLVLKQPIPCTPGDLLHLSSEVAKAVSRPGIGSLAGVCQFLQ